MDLLNELNEEQRQAVEHTEGPLLVLAGPGTGKTKTVTHRIAYLILEKKVLPWRILAITFTKKAADEMKARVEGLLGKEVADRVKIGTFHNFCNFVLRQNRKELEGYGNGYQICDEKLQGKIFQEVISELGLPAEGRDYKRNISLAKNKFLTPQEYESEQTKDGTMEAGELEDTCTVYEEYQKRLTKQGLLDFDDLVMKAVELFEKHPEILEKYQNRFRYLMVDEYQDTNEAQFRLVELLAGKYRNICVVGDDDQAIYSFRGADDTHIKNFDKTYPETEVVRLQRNYRSVKTITKSANMVILNNYRRKDKRILSDRNGEKIHVRKYEDYEAEAEGVAEIIKEKLIQWKTEEEKTEKKTIAVLARTNRRMDKIKEVLEKKGILFSSIGEVDFLDRKEVKDVLAYFRVLADENEEEALERIIDVPARGIGEKSLEKIKEYQEKKGIGMYAALREERNIPELPESAREGISQFLHIMDELGRQWKEGKTLAKVFDCLMELTGYPDTLEARRRNYLEYLKQQMERFEPERLAEREAWGEAKEENYLKDFLEEIALETGSVFAEKAWERVQLMTLHKSKGLEFTCVILVGVEEGVLPSARSENEDEERRLFYVGMTRAEEYLYLTYALKADRHSKESSKFLHELPEDYWEGEPLVKAGNGVHVTSRIPVTILE